MIDLNINRLTSNELLSNDTRGQFNDGGCTRQPPLGQESVIFSTMLQPRCYLTARTRFYISQQISFQNASN